MDDADCGTLGELRSLLGLSLESERCRLVTAKEIK